MTGLDSLEATPGRALLTWMRLRNGVAISPMPIVLFLFVPVCSCWFLFIYVFFLRFSCSFFILFAFQFLGKTNWEAQLHNQPESAHFVTVIDEPSNCTIDFFKTEDETGDTIGNGIWEQIVVPTESQDTLCCIGSGKEIL